MKVFVIKNKEGKYFLNRYVQAKKIYNAFIFEDKNDAKQVKGKDDEVVEITIAEGDLEKAIRKQVCNEIRKEFENRYKGKHWEDNIAIGKVCNTINDVLDKIEQGECEDDSR